jgi:hypothetical protein
LTHEYIPHRAVKKRTYDPLPISPRVDVGDGVARPGIWGRAFPPSLKLWGQACAPRHCVPSLLFVTHGFPVTRTRLRKATAEKLVTTILRIANDLREDRAIRRAHVFTGCPQLRYRGTGGYARSFDCKFRPVGRRALRGSDPADVFDVPLRGAQECAPSRVPIRII